MALGLELKLRMGMQLVMTPQLQMAIKLLQMSSLDLADYLQEELEKNPLLEREDGAGEGGESSEPQKMDESREHYGAEGEESFPMRPESTDIVKEREKLDRDNPESGLNEDLQVDASWDDVYGDSYSALPFENSTSTEAPPLENTLTGSQTLQDHLVWQLGVSALNEKERSLGLALIDAIDENGYLTTDLNAIAEMIGTSEEDLEDALILIQSFDPAGVGARNLAECLYLQLKNEGMAHPPYTLLLENLEDLARRDFRKLKRILKLDEEELSEAVAVIQSLNPKPGLAYGSDQTNYVVPDVFVKKIEGEWVVEINPETQPRLRINRAYEAALGSNISSQDKRFLADNARSAQWLIKSLEQRSSTIFRVAESIVRFQKDFLDHGQEYLKPLILKDVADDIGVHESTTSRVTSNKYMHTPRGIFELKFFFSSSLGSQTGGENHSSEAVKYKIRKLVDSEPANRPFSDEKLAKLLQEQGIDVARRTVAKYRDALNIPSSSRRKQLAPKGDD
ncbi:MAG: RNA polymerase factor sigma-54 [Magnetococcales bacterium]|nr:RNA polymerase factor sigma-54 [Magnetococcales bacterium]MBF0151272.1 RNA polymerase factor sigma-54 [Magnetococcales bacterium]MBF0174163.1 RNA polymerase factor sigma-54 [Magnetococcales bacterium]MBF0347373.1 RNA polymerase factor sigma-54 [Magnetococcales bacterium]MBF0632738.1 RNA polymerase factor sigma-54 [Magnetococcales bacterium]